MVFRQNIYFFPCPKQFHREWPEFKQQLRDNAFISRNIKFQALMMVTTKIHVLSESVPKCTANNVPEINMQKNITFKLSLFCTGFQGRHPCNGTHFKVPVITDRKTNE